MDFSESNGKIIVISGLTGSGKTSMAIDIALSKKKVELINCDNVQMYVDFDIGSAKEKIINKSSSDLGKYKAYSKAAEIPVWLIDFLSPTFQISVGQFQSLVRSKIFEIQSRGNTPILVGGSGYYINSVLFDYKFSKDQKFEIEKISKMTVEEMKSEVQKLGFDLKQINNSDRNNPRRLSNILLKLQNQDLPHALHYFGKFNNKKFYDFDLILLMPDQASLDKKLKKRVKEMFNNGLIEECKSILDKYGNNLIPNLRNAVGYKQVFEEIEAGKVNIEYLKKKVFISHRQLSRKQRTWFKKYLLKYASSSIN